MGRSGVAARLVRTFAAAPPLVSAVTASVLLASAAPLHAWSESTQLEIAAAATRLAPPDLARQIEKHKSRLREGVLKPFRDGDPARHEKNPDGSGRLDQVIADEARRAIQLIRSHRPFYDVVEQLGVVLHFVADANHPFHAAEEPGESGYAGDFLRYTQTAEPRFAAAYYGLDTRLDRIESIPSFVARALQRSRALYPFIAAEYRRIGGRSGVGAFDDRSTAFGVAAVSFSRALTDGAAMLRLVWLEAGGADPLARPPLESDRIVKLPRGREVRRTP